MNNKAILIANGSLGDFLDLTETHRHIVFFELHPSAKDLIEAQGIPHTALFKLEINGKEKTLDYNLQDGDEISVYPFETVNKNTFDPIFSSPTSFIVDVHLGKLARTLRLLGFNAQFNTSWDDDDIIRLSNSAHGMILTRDIELLKNGDTKYGYWIRSTDPDQQIKELFQRFSLRNQIKPFSRCMKCNGLLEKVRPDEVEDRIPPKVKKWHSIFYKCSNCGQVYWKGSHFNKLEQKVAALIKQSK